MGKEFSSFFYDPREATVSAGYSEKCVGGWGSVQNPVGELTVLPQKTPSW